MKYAVKYAAALVTGAAIGGIVTAGVLNAKKRAELEGVRKVLRTYYDDKTAKETERATSEAYAELERTQTELNNAIDQLHAAQTKEETPKNDDSKVYILKPDEFGTIPDYDRFYYTYCTDDGKFYIDAGMDTPAEEVEIEDMFQKLHPEQHFGEYEDDAVYIRNDDLKTDIVVYLADEAIDEEDE